MGDIYKITNIVNNKIYIGQTLKFSSTGKKMGYEKRFKTHLNNSLNKKTNGCPLLERAFRKYGYNNFQIQLLKECSIIELNDYETYYIQFFNSTTPFGYNLLSGGGNGRKHSIVSREKMSKTRKGKVHKECTKDKISAAHTGKNITEKTRKSLSFSRKKNSKDDYPQEIKNALKELNLEFLPMYIVFSFDKRPTRMTYNIIVRSPNNPSKKFASKYLPITIKIKKAIDYLNTINGHRS